MSTPGDQSNKNDGKQPGNISNEDVVFKYKGIYFDEEDIPCWTTGDVFLEEPMNPMEVFAGDVIPLKMSCTSPGEEEPMSCTSPVQEESQFPQYSPSHERPHSPLNTPIQEEHHPPPQEEQHPPPQEEQHPPNGQGNSPPIPTVEESQFPGRINVDEPYVSEASSSSGDEADDVEDENDDSEDSDEEGFVIRERKRKIVGEDDDDEEYTPAVDVNGDEDWGLDFDEEDVPEVEEVAEVAEGVGGRRLFADALEDFLLKQTRRAGDSDVGVVGEEAPTLWVGQEWENSEACRLSLRMYGLAHRFQVKFKKNNALKAIVVCSEEGCPFRVYARKVPSGNAFRLRKCNLEHTKLSLQVQDGRFRDLAMLSLQVQLKH